jgi:arginyl-tRNA synthetase
MKLVLREKIKEALEKSELSAENFSIEKPNDSANGDYATNVALVAGGNSKENAEALVRLLNDAEIEYVEKIEIAGAGFINFYLTDEYFTDKVFEIIEKGDSFGKNESFKDKKIIFEYTDPNPFKEFHIGHMMSNAIGESFARLSEFSGAEVKRANYQGDVGMHLAKAIWGMRELKIAGKEIDKPEQLGVAYVLGAEAFEENEQTKGEITAINKKIYERSDEEINKLYDKGREISLVYFEGIYKKLGTQFDFYFFESEASQPGKQLVEENIGEVFVASEGAIVFPEEKSNLHTRVFVNSEGLPTYEAKELALAKIKYERFLYDVSVVITANEIKYNFKVLLKAMSFIYPELAEKTWHVGHGIMIGPGGKKMSSRTGDVLPALQIITEVKKKVLEKMKDVALENKDVIAEQVAISALKYSILKQTIGKNIIFDMEQATSFEGDSGPYLQYSYARAKSVLRKAEENNIHAEKVLEVTPGAVEKLLEYFEEVVTIAQKDATPHTIAHYLISLASAFNTYYAKQKIVDTNSIDSSYHVAVTTAFAITIKNGLWLLGIEAPEQM